MAFQWAGIMRKTVHIKLQYYCRLDTTVGCFVAVDYYVVEQLRNAASCSVGSKFFRVNDRVTPEEADQLCDIQHYEVTINK